MTQLFTAPYMVAFLLDNSVGAWWAARRLSADDLRTAESEDELRRKAAIPGVPLEYLRFVKGEHGTWIPAAATFDAWPEHLSELKVMNPCCGSGHFLVAAFQMLVPMRMALEGCSIGVIEGRRRRRSTSVCAAQARGRATHPGSPRRHRTSAANPRHGAAPHDRICTSIPPIPRGPRSGRRTIQRRSSVGA